jgi:hypothetical protein
MSTLQPVRLPPALARFADPATRPLHIGSAEVEILFEFWWSCNGHGLLNKLVRCETLTPVPHKVGRQRMFKTEPVLKLYHDLTS